MWINLNFLNDGREYTMKNYLIKHKKLNFIQKNYNMKKKLK